jgi:hypothetical protein
LDTCELKLEAPQLIKKWGVSYAQASHDLCCASVTVARLGEALEILLKFCAVLMIEEKQALMHASE